MEAQKEDEFKQAKEEGESTIQSVQDTDAIVRSKLPKGMQVEEYKHSKKADLRREALASKREHKARISLAHATNQQQASIAQQQISQAIDEKKKASLAVKNEEIQNEIEGEKNGLMAEQATDAETQAVNKLRSYQNADSSIQDTSIAPETETMK